MLRFHVNLYARPPGLIQTRTIQLRGVELDELVRGDPPLALDAFFPVTFEQAAAALRRLPQIDVEPDGFFVHSGELAGECWQVDGHLFDFNDRLHRVELHGECPEDVLDGFLRCFSWPQTPLAFELPREGSLLDEVNFRRWSRGC